MADPKPVSAAGSDGEVFLSASEDEGPQQEVTPELLNALVKQVEFYFSDANLPTDKKLLKQIRKDPEGYVPVKLFANFRKVRALSKDVSIITEALRGATLLQLSSDCKRVKRIAPVPDYDISDIQKRTIVVENLPGNPSPTIESVTEAFRMYGRVKLVRICSRESKGKLPSWLTSSCQSMNGQQHAYVEFEEEEGAVLAAAALAYEGDPSDGTMQVRRLLNCIAEQRERRSAAGSGSSYGGSSVGLTGSRKGSRDVSPLGSRSGGSRRNSGGGSATAISPPLATRGVSAGGGRPPAHPPAALATSALAEAIAAVQAERRASEAGAKASAAVAPVTDATPAAAVAAALAPLARPAPSAPKFCLDLGARGRHPIAGTAPAVEGAINSPRQPAAAKHAAPAAPPSSSTTAAAAAAAAAAASIPQRNPQMVSNVEDFINNILSRPAGRPTPAPLAPAQRKVTSAAPAQKQAQQAQRQQSEPVDAAAAVAGILASALRRPAPSGSATTSPTGTPAPSKASIVAPVSQPPPLPTPAAPAPGPVLFITAMMPGDADGDGSHIMDLDLEHAVTVTVHRCPASLHNSEKAAAKVAAAATETTLTSTVPVSIVTTSTTVSSNVSSAASSPREHCDETSHCASQARSAGVPAATVPVQRVGQHQQLHTSSGKRATRREYAQWAAATPEFRAEAASKYGVAADGASIVVATGGVARCSAGGIVTSAASPLAFSVGAVPSSISDGGAVASPSPAHTPVMHAPAWHVARGPDGTRGFSGRRALAI
ncbi:hypothetical protein GPECTOR_1g252 [Gonium pectorale]|uniref:HTH La-type RNA-binding domain-containing protein n=1 Tax=Gonium pectorale TaxID=33097 RepID=A0A150H2A6_GONPE|nr:hypothetical protein GPECTOR_1g252 [Gonium pectorale]|eukprot:KXZ56287.1 hypothetical protein GPECTOR_1g252 [Gonium pectorale]